MFLSIVQLVALAVVQSSFYFGKHSLISKLLHCAYDAMLLLISLLLHSLIKATCAALRLYR